MLEYPINAALFQAATSELALAGRKSDFYLRNVVNRS